MPSQFKSVSVVMATHNGAKFIEAQLQSIFNQTFPPSEIIISDDASSDATLEIVKRLTSKCGIATKVLKNEKPLGFRDNFLRASLLASSNFIAFCDQDDIWDKSKLEKCSEYFYDPKISMIVHAAITIDVNSKKIGTFQQGINQSNIRQPLNYDPWLTFFGFSIVFRRELLDLASIHDRFIDYIVPTEMIAHDRWIMFLGQVAGLTAEIADPLVCYRQHDNNAFGSQPKNKNPFGGDIKHLTDCYIESTEMMLRIARKFPDNTKDIFPAYDKAKSLRFLEKALDQLTARRSIYNSASLVASLEKIYRCAKSGNYRSVHNGRFRWRSLIRDLQFAFTGR